MWLWVLHLYSPMFYCNYSFWFLLVVNIVLFCAQHYYRKKESLKQLDFKFKSKNLTLFPAILRLFIKLGRIDEEQAALEQLTLSDFKKWSPTAVKTFHNYTIIITNMWHFCLSCLLFELIQQATLVNFTLFLNIFKILKILFWTFWRQNCISLPLWALLSLKPCKAFRIAQCKQLRLVKPCLNFDL